MYSLIAYGKTINAHLTYYIHAYNRMLLYMNVYDTIKCIFLQCLVVKSSAPACLHMYTHVDIHKLPLLLLADWLAGRLFWHAIGELVLRPPVQRCNCARAHACARFCRPTAFQATSLASAIRPNARKRKRTRAFREPLSAHTKPYKTCIHTCV